MQVRHCTRCLSPIGGVRLGSCWSSQTTSAGQARPAVIRRGAGPAVFHCTPKRVRFHRAACVLSACDLCGAHQVCWRPHRASRCLRDVFRRAGPSASLGTQPRHAPASCFLAVLTGPGNWARFTRCTPPACGPAAAAEFRHAARLLGSFIIQMGLWCRGDSCCSGQRVPASPASTRPGIRSHGLFQQREGAQSWLPVDTCVPRSFASHLPGSLQAWPRICFPGPRPPRLHTASLLAHA